MDMWETEQQALDFLEEGIDLFNNNDVSSKKKALEFFIKANKVVAEYSVRRVNILYYLALCNRDLGNTSLAYAILTEAQKVGRIASQLTFFVSEKIPTEHIDKINSLKTEMENGNYDISQSKNFKNDDFNKILAL